MQNRILWNSSWILLYCSLIDENCLECDYLKTNSEFKCKKCKEHYFPNNDGLCELWEEEDCLKCSDKNFCIECKEGKTAYPDGKCYLNIENCKIGNWCIFNRKKLFYMHWV